MLASHKSHLRSSYQTAFEMQREAPHVAWMLAEDDVVSKQAVKANSIKQSRRRLKNASNCGSQVIQVQIGTDWV